MKNLNSSEEKILQDFNEKFVDKRTNNKKFRILADPKEIEALISQAIATTRAEVLEEAERALPQKSNTSLPTPLCRVCRHSMITSTGLGKVAFPYQCPNCNNYQEEKDEFTNGFNECLYQFGEAINNLKKK